MRLSFTLQPDGTSGFDLQTDAADHPGMIEMGFKQFNYMVKTIGEGQVNYDDRGNGLPEAGREGRSVSAGDTV